MTARSSHSLPTSARCAAAIDSTVLSNYNAMEAGAFQCLQSPPWAPGASSSSKAQAVLHALPSARSTTTTTTTTTTTHPPTWPAQKGAPLVWN